jgi:hypothetical protein
VLCGAGAASDIEGHLAAALGLAAAAGQWTIAAELEARRIGGGR